MCNRAAHSLGHSLLKNIVFPMRIQYIKKKPAFSPFPGSHPQDDAPELEEGFIVNITEVYLVNSDLSAEQPRVQRPGMEMVEIIIEENDDPRGIFNFHVTRVR